MAARLSLMALLGGYRGRRRTSRQIDASLARLDYRTPQ
jgi:hypothetical protein